VDPTEVAIDEGVARLRAVLRAHGQAEVSFGVVVPRARLEVGVLVVARGWRSMTTRSITQRVAAGLLAGSRARWATSANTTRSATSTSSRRPPDRRADARPLPQPILRPCATQPARGDDLDLTAPGGGRGLLRGHYREIDATSRASAARSTWSAPAVVDHLGDRVPGLRVCYLVEYAGSSPAQDSQLP
jgi:hypothetical protein